MEAITCKIREDSLLARLAARKLRSARIAITLGRNIYLWNTARSEFLADPAWVRHELCHVEQFRRYGFFRFLWLYLRESLRHGYEENKYELEARAAERQEAFPIRYVFTER